MSSSPNGTAPEVPQDLVLTLQLHENGHIEVWQREGRTGPDFAKLLRQIADAFETGENIKRTR